MLNVHWYPTIERTPCLFARLFSKESCKWQFTLPLPPMVYMCKTKIKTMFPSWKGVEVEDDFKLEIMTAIEASDEDTVATKGQRREANF